VSVIIISGVTGINSEVCQGILSRNVRDVSDVVRETSIYLVRISATVLEVIQDIVGFISLQCEKRMMSRLLLNGCVYLSNRRVYPMCTVCKHHQTL